jgi:hypothetical protein
VSCRRRYSSYYFFRYFLGPETGTSTPMAAAAPLDFNGFLGNIAALGTVNTDGPGFVGAMAYALTEAGRLKS